MKKLVVKEPKYKRVKISDKLEIIRKLDDGSSKSALATEYGVTRSTIIQIYSNKKNTIDYAKVKDYAEVSYHSSKV